MPNGPWRVHTSLTCEPRRGGPPVARPVVLVHGAATTSRVWRDVVPRLDGFEVRCPDRACSGDLATEVAALTADCRGALVAGVSGGATLGLALAAAGVPMAAAILPSRPLGHCCPACWIRSAPPTPQEERPPLPKPSTAPRGRRGRPRPTRGRWPGTWPCSRPSSQRRRPRRWPVVITVGEFSPPVRHESVRRLAARFGLRCGLFPVPGTRCTLSTRRFSPPPSAGWPSPTRTCLAPRGLVPARRPAGPAGHPGPQAPAGSGRAAARPR